MGGQGFCVVFLGSKIFWGLYQGAGGLPVAPAGSGVNGETVTCYLQGFVGGHRQSLNRVWSLGCFWPLAGLGFRV